MFQIDQGNLISLKEKIDVMKDIDSVPSNVQCARQEDFIVCVCGQ